MIVGCPSCGGQVEFRFDSSFVRVCAYCNAAVLRTDRGIETLGRFADLVPIESPLRLFAEGNYGGAGFLLVGMAQLRHSAGGMWQEWYAKLGGDAWAWLSEAQGRLYWTAERPDVRVPPFGALAPGMQIAIDGAPFTVGERGVAGYASALGEIPYRLDPAAQFRFADLSDGRDGFATIDYGATDHEPPAVYVGRQVALGELRIMGGEQPVAAPRATAASLTCPNCNGALELRAPDQSLRVACPYCNHLVSVEGGQLAILARQTTRPVPVIELGATAKLDEGELTVIGYVARSAQIDGTWYPFEEYLLHAPAVGFRWLVCSDGHWSYVQPVATGAVERGLDARYRGVRFQRFQTARLRVDAVLGELYWRVEVGEKVDAEDYIAPPAMLSRESSRDEINWSLASYRTRDDLHRAFGRSLPLRRPTGVAPNQPYPGGVGAVIGIAIAALLAVGVARCQTMHRTGALTERLIFAPASAQPPAQRAEQPAQPPAPLAEQPAPDVQFSQPFHLDGGRNVEVAVSADGLSDAWAYLVLDLVNEATGSMITFDQALDYYSGVEAGEAWSEGSTRGRELLGPVTAGDYVLRIEAQHTARQPLAVIVQVNQGVFRTVWLLVALGVLAVVFGLVCLHGWWFHRARWTNSNTVTRSSGDDDDD